jgi:hypothetical protein
MGTFSCLFPMTDQGPELALRDQVEKVAGELERAILDASAYDTLAVEDVQRLLAAASKIYVGKLERSGPFSPFPAHGQLVVTATEAAATASGMLKALQIEVFELGMWQTQAGL